MNFEKVIEHLRALGRKEVDPIDNNQGLCSELSERFYFSGDVCLTDEQLEDVQDLMNDWPKSSDEIEFPVPHPTMDPVESYCVCDDLWGDDEYGDNRRELCLWLADELERRGGV